MTSDCGGFRSRHRPLSREKARKKGPRPEISRRVVKRQGKGAVQGGNGAGLGLIAAEEEHKRDGVVEGIQVEG